MMVMMLMLLSSTAETHSDIVVTNNFPIQKWVHIGIVIDNKIMDVYLDGKMVKSVKLQDNISPHRLKIILSYMVLLALLPLIPTLPNINV
jgi:hypothetical protein